MDKDFEITPEMKDLLPDFPSGPLDVYRKKASFDWRKMKVLLESEEIIKFKMKIYRTLESDPLFNQHPAQELSRDEYRRLTFLRIKRIAEYDFLSDKEFAENPLLMKILYSVFGHYDFSLGIKKFTGHDLVIMAVLNAGSYRHYKLLPNIRKFQSWGCFALTEMGHGSNTKGIMTRADFDPKTNQFILNTPNLEATKVWAGNLGSNATHAVVFAQLYVNKVCHGLSQFLIPIRDPKTLLPYHGIIVGDMGPKIGLNGVDNGFLQFNNYRVPKSVLMNRLGDVNEEGNYVMKIKDEKKRIGISLGTLSMGRVSIIGHAVLNMQKCLPIAIRYSAVRKQFGPSNDQEIPVLEYQMQQWRLIPFLASCYLLDNFSTWFSKEMINFQMKLLFDKITNELEEYGQEIHALSSGGKPLSGWICRDAIQECREACGGHGYLKASGFGTLRNDHDANLTYEGENNVLQMQTSNYLIRSYQLKMEKGQTLNSKFGSVNFLNRMDEHLKKRMVLQTPEDTMRMDVILDAYKFLMSFLIKESVNKLKHELDNGHDLFTARSNSQVYYCRSLSMAYVEHTIIERWNEFLLNNNNIDNSLLIVLKRLGLLYGLWALEKHLSTLYQGGYCNGPLPTEYIRESILHLCFELKDDAVALADVISPPDFILNSVLGNSDGNIYQNIFQSYMSNPKAMDRPSWWRDFCDNKPKIASITPKL